MKQDLRTFYPLTLLVCWSIHILKFIVSQSQIQGFSARVHRKMLGGGLSKNLVSLLPANFIVVILWGISKFKLSRWFRSASKVFRFLKVFLLKFNLVKRLSFRFNSPVRSGNTDGNCKVIIITILITAIIINNCTN